MIFLFNARRQFDITSVVIQTFWLVSHITGNDFVSMFLIHLGFIALPITKSNSKSPPALGNNKTINISFEALQPLHFSPLSTKFCLAIHKKKVVELQKIHRFCLTIQLPVPHSQTFPLHMTSKIWCAFFETFQANCFMI